MTCFHLTFSLSQFLKCKEMVAGPDIAKVVSVVLMTISICTDTSIYHPYVRHCPRTKQGSMASRTFLNLSQKFTLYYGKQHEPT
jgi:hypothetical protein